MEFNHLVWGVGEHSIQCRVGQGCNGHSTTPLVHVKHTHKADVLVITQAKVTCQVGKEGIQASMVCLLGIPRVSKQGPIHRLQKDWDPMLIGIHYGCNATRFWAMLLKPIMEIVEPNMDLTKDQQGVNHGELKAWCTEPPDVGQVPRNFIICPQGALLVQNELAVLNSKDLLTHGIDHCLCGGKGALHAT